MSDIDNIKISSKNDILLNSLFQFYKDNNYMEVILPIINGISNISLRLLDWFVTNYSKKYNIIYTSKNNINPFNVHLDYKLQLKAYNKKYFDPFCRKNRILFDYKNNTAIKTTVGQLNFFRWALKNEILEYVYNNLTEISNDMNMIYQNRKKEKIEGDSLSNSLEKKENELISSNSISYSSNETDSNSDEAKKIKRKELSNSATKTVNKHNMTITLNFD
jgi:hypothetical protein